MYAKCTPGTHKKTLVVKHLNIQAEEISKVLIFT